MPQNAASRYAERIQTYWLPEALALPERPPADDEGFGKLLSQIDGLVINLEDGVALALSPHQLALWNQLSAVLAGKQKALLPKMRRRYSEALDTQMFRRDIRVAMKGGATLVLTGGAFTRNANVEDMEVALQPMLARLRFRQAEYRWSSHLREGLRYDLSPPADGVIARWVGDRYALLKRPENGDAKVEADPDCVPNLAAAAGLTC